MQTSTPRRGASSVLPVSWSKKEYRVLPIVFAVCTCSALLSARWHASSVLDELVISYAIGFSSYSLMQIVRLFLRGRLPVWGLVATIPVGFIVGSKLAKLLGAPDVAALMFHNPAAMREPILDTLMLIVVITAFFLYFSHTRGMKEDLERERRRAAEALQAETLARLALLQAQIEPHFLFNTLANIHSLIQEDPDTASLMLEQLNSYLRTSLRRTRNATSTLGEELDLVEALLGIAGMRLRARLDYTISAPADLRPASLPPLLLQPLVENAIRHGIEPAVGGGKIQVQARRRDGFLELTVSDTGVGFDDSAPEGVGLSNVRARLQSLYGVQGKLEFYGNSPCGVTVKVLVPAPNIL
jgi:signal transduction histidine kinase